MKNKIFLFALLGAASVILNLPAWGVTPVAPIKKPPYVIQNTEEKDPFNQYMYERVLNKRWEAEKKAYASFNKKMISELEIREGWGEYVEVLKAIMIDLGQRYYPPEVFGKKGARGYVEDIMASMEDFYTKKMTGPTSEPPDIVLGTSFYGNLYEVMAGDLEERIADMVSHAALESDQAKNSSFNFDAWLKEWGAIGQEGQEDDSDPNQNQYLPKSRQRPGGNPSQPYR